MKYARLILEICLAVALFSASHVTAAVPLDDFKVNDDGGTDLQDHPRIAVAPDGSFAVVWADRRGGVSDIYMQRYGADGVAIGRNVRITDDADLSFQKDPAIATDYANSFGVVWKDYREAGYPFNPDVYFQRLDAAMARLGSNLNLTTEFPDTLRETPDIALASWGKGIVVWSDYRNYQWDVYGQLIAPDGSPIGENFQINDDVGTAQQHAPRVSSSAEGWFVVTWFDDRYGDNDIFVQVYDSSGSTLGINYRVDIPRTGTRQAFPDVTTDGAGNFTVVWVTWQNGNYPDNPDIYARKFRKDLTPVTDAYMVNSDGTYQAQRQPAIAADRLGNVAIIWADSTVTASWNIVGQMIDVDGVVREQTFIANSYADSMQVQPDVALDGKYRYVTWVDKRRGNFDIFAAVQQYNSPQLVSAPSAVSFSFREGESLPSAKKVAVEHNGYNPIAYGFAGLPSWLSASPTTGTTPDSVTLTVSDGSLTKGSYAADIQLIDLGRNDSSATIAVSLTVLPPDTVTPTDTLFLEPANAMPGEMFVVPAWLTLNDAKDSLDFRLNYDTSGMSLDSVVFDQTYLISAELNASWSTNGELSIFGNTADSVAQLPTGRHLFADLWFTAGLNPGSYGISDDGRLSKARDVGGAWTRTAVTGGDIIVDQSTAVDSPDELTPHTFQLDQNYPNPFNAGTIIRFVLPRRTEVRLDIFNILGQIVGTPVDGILGAGEHQVSWEGYLPDGRPAPSGIYFYRLGTEAAVEVRKMVLIK